MTGTQHRITRFALASLVTTTLLAVAVFPSISAGSQTSPEITDAAGDVSPAVFATNKTIDNATISAIYQNATAYDVVKAWVGLESASDFWIFVEVRDLPDGWGAIGDPPEESPFGANLTHAGTSLVANFTIQGISYQAVAKLAMPGPGKLFDNYTLWNDGSRGDISGAYNTTEDWVAMKLPKAAFPGLVDGTVMSQFWIQGRFANRSMDYAPNARDSFGGTPDPLVLLGNIQNGTLVTPNYGFDYTFGQYYHPESGSGGNWGVAPNIQLAAIGEYEKIVEPGRSVDYEMRITNKATADDTVYFAVSSAGAGWSHQLSTSQLMLAPGASKTFTLTVAAANGAEGMVESLVSASSILGGEDELTFTTIVKMEDDTPMSSDPAPQEPEPDPLTTQPKGGSPGFAVGAVVGATLLAVFLIRRRK